MGLITFGGLYMRIEGFEYTKRFTVTEDSIDNATHPYDIEAPPGQTITLNLNNPEDGFVKGIEINWQGTFWYLLKTLGQPWEYIQVRIDSTLDRPLINQPETIYNIREQPYPPWAGFIVQRIDTLSVTVD